MYYYVILGLCGRSEESAAEVHPIDQGRSTRSQNGESNLSPITSLLKKRQNAVSYNNQLLNFITVTRVTSWQFEPICWC